MGRPTSEKGSLFLYVRYLYQCCIPFEGVTILFQIREVPIVYRGPETGHPARRFRGFPNSFQENARIVTKIGLRPSVIAFYAVRSEVLDTKSI